MTISMVYQKISQQCFFVYFSNLKAPVHRYPDIFVSATFLLRIEVWFKKCFASTRNQKVSGFILVSRTPRAHMLILCFTQNRSKIYFFLVMDYGVTQVAQTIFA